MDPGTLLIRADSNVAMGTGHAMRCLALAQAWQDASGKAVMAMAEATPATEDKLRREDVEVVHLDTAAGTEGDAIRTGSLAEQRQAAWVTVDGYQFNSVYQAKIKSKGLRLMTVDDDGRSGPYSADLVLNQNAHATEALYGQRATHTRLLLGSDYAMLRRQFASWRNWQREIPATGHRILVTMGGSDPGNFTLRVMEALSMVEMESLEGVVVVGGSNPHVPALEAAAKSQHAVRLAKNADNMPELMAWADLAVSAAGTTCWEMCFLGLPAVVVDLAANQRPVAQRLDELGVACHLGSSRECSTERIARELKRLLADAETRSRMCRRGRALVDGRGAARVCAAMIGSGIRLRPATEADCRLLWEWANEPGVRASAFSQQPIGWDEHTAWFRAQLADAASMILIGEDAGGRTIGQVRIHRQTSCEAEIDVSVARDFRGAGYGSLLIDAAVREAAASAGITRVHAFIRPENGASARAFENAGFRRMGEEQVKGNLALHYCRG